MAANGCFPVQKLHILNNPFCFVFIDLALLYKLVSRVPNATVELKKIVEDHIRQMGTDAIERVSGTALNVSLTFCSILRVY